MPAGSYGEKAASVSDDDEEMGSSFSDSGRGGGARVERQSGLRSKFPSKKGLFSKKGLWIALTLTVCALVTFVGVGVARELVWRGRIHGVKVHSRSPPTPPSSAYRVRVLDSRSHTRALTCPLVSPLH